MDATEFRTAWEELGDQLCRYSAETLLVSRLPENTKRFLETAGLPIAAAPFLSFAPGTLDWLRQAGDDLDRFFPLGSDGSGDPLAVDEDGIVWLIDHEAPARRTLVNSSVSALAECLLAYRALVVEAVAIGGENAVLDGRIPRHLIEAFSGSIAIVDPTAAQPGSFWGWEVSRLSAEAI